MFSLGYYQQLTKDDRIKWLKKQKAGTIIGDYRNQLYLVYKHIESKCHNSLQYCIYEQLFPEASWRGIYNPYEYCVELRELGYISILHTGSYHKLSIVKDLDF